MGLNPEVHLADDRVRCEKGGETLLEVPLDRFLEELRQSLECGTPDRTLPRNVRLWIERRDAVGVAVELSPGPRTVRWLAEDSRAPFGRPARYGRYYLAFPYVLLLLVFRHGSLTGMQQLYYRTASLDEGDDLLLPNLYNVAKGYGQRCWVCLQSLPELFPLPWHEKIEAVERHTFEAAFNRSSEVHEQNSYWSSMKGLDPRYATPEAWQEATRQNPFFPLEVAWKPAGTTARAELRSMLDRVVRLHPLRNAEDLTVIVTRAGARSRRKR